jgi:ribonuclease HI
VEFFVIVHMPESSGGDELMPFGPFNHVAAPGNHFPNGSPVPKIPALAAAMGAMVDDSMRDFERTDSMRQYLLVCHARSVCINQGVWCFSLESITGEPILEAECEEEGDLNRLSLLAAVRGLEAIDGRGLVSLISNNRYLIRSLDRSLPRWRENDFVWEQFGRKMPVQNADLWRRIDRTLIIHSVTASLLQTTRVSTGNASVDEATYRSRQVDKPIMRFDEAHSPLNSGPSDGLRRWLAGNCDAAPISTRRGRYRPADLVEN